MYIIGTHDEEDRLFCDFGPEETLMATRTVMLIKQSGYDVVVVSEEEYKARLEKFKSRTGARKAE